MERQEAISKVMNMTIEEVKAKLISFGWRKMDWPAIPAFQKPTKWGVRSCFEGMERDVLIEEMTEA